MEYIALFIITVCCSVLIYQDFKQRTISVYVVIALGVGLFLSSLQSIFLREYLYYVLINISIVLILLGCIFIYHFIKNKQVSNFIDKSIGWGDLLLLVILSLGFSPINFVAFILITLLLTLILHTLSAVIRPNSNEQIPLAGYLSVFLLIVSFLSLPIKPLNPFDDQLLFNLLIF